MVTEKEYEAVEIYSFPSVNLTKVLLTAQELDVGYRLHLMEAGKGEHKTARHLARHPLGMVPAVDIDGEYFIESNAICRLLAERSGNRLYADTPEARARINQWIDLMAHHIGRHMQVFMFEERIKPEVLGRTTDDDAVAEAAEALTDELPFLESRLSRRGYLTGEEITLADIIAFSYCHIHEYTSLDFGGYPHLRDWFRRIKARPAFERAVAHTRDGNLFPFAPRQEQ